jgi:hypothetical protein
MKVSTDEFRKLLTEKGTVSIMEAKAHFNDSDPLAIRQVAKELVDAGEAELVPNDRLRIQLKPQPIAKLVDKTISVDIFDNDRLDPNAHALLGAFAKQAKKDGWTQEEIDTVVAGAKDGDYDHLMQTLMRHIE